MWRCALPIWPNGALVYPVYIGAAGSRYRFGYATTYDEPPRRIFGAIGPARRVRGATIANRCSIPIASTDNCTLDMIYCEGVLRLLSGWARARILESVRNYTPMAREWGDICKLARWGPTWGRPGRAQIKTDRPPALSKNNRTQATGLRIGMVKARDGVIANRASREIRQKIPKHPF